MGRMYHVYQHGYSVLPALNKLGKNVIFQITLNDVDRYLAEKQTALKNQTVFVEHGMTDEIYERVCQFIVKKYPWRLREPHTFCNIAEQIQEDIAIHRLDEHADWLAAAHVSFPSGWLPEEKIGRTFEEIHRPVPGMKTNRKLVEAMMFSGPFERYVWGVVFEDRINGHPSVPKKPFDPASPVVFVKVERQITVGFPDLGAALFVIRQFLIKESEIDKPALVKSLQAMTDEQRQYKGLSDIEPLLSYLSS